MRLREGSKDTEKVMVKCDLKVEGRPIEWGRERREGEKTKNKVCLKNVVMKFNSL